MYADAPIDIKRCVEHGRPNFSAAGHLLCMIEPTARVTEESVACVDNEIEAVVNDDLALTSA